MSIAGTETMIKKTGQQRMPFSARCSRKFMHPLHDIEIFKKRRNFLNAWNYSILVASNIRKFPSIVGAKLVFVLSRMKFIFQCDFVQLLSSATPMDSRVPIAENNKVRLSQSLGFQ